MKNYRELSREESTEISEASCQLEMNKILNKYYLQVFKLVIFVTKVNKITDTF